MVEFSNALLNALFWARVLAPQDGGDEIRPEHIILGAFSEPSLIGEEAAPLRSVLAVPPSFAEDFTRVMGTVGASGQPEQPSNGDLPLSKESGRLVEAATMLAAQRGEDQVGPLHLLLAAVREGGDICHAMEGAGITQSAIERALGSVPPSGINLS